MPFWSGAAFNEVSACHRGIGGNDIYYVFSFPDDIDVSEEIIVDTLPLKVWFIAE